MAKASSLVYKLRAEYEGQRDLQQLQKDLKAVGEIESFRKLEGSIKDAEKELAGAKENLAAVSKELASSKDPKLAKALEKVANTSAGLEEKFRKQTQAVAKTSDELDKAAAEYQAYERAMAGSVASDKAIAQFERLQTKVQTLASRLERQQTILGQTTTAMDESAKAASEMEKAYEKSVDPAIQKKYNKLESEVSSLNKTIGRQKSELDKSTAAFKEQGIEINNLDSRYDKISATIEGQSRTIAARKALEIRSWSDIKQEIAGLERAYKDLESSGALSAKELAAAQEKLRQKTKSLNAEMDVQQKKLTAANMVMNSLRATAASLVASFGIYEMAAFASSVWDAGIASEALDRSFKAIYGSAPKAQEELNWLRQIADELGGDFQSLAQTYIAVAAAAQGTNLSNDSVRQLFTSIVETGTALGATSDEISRAVAQMAQGISRGKFELEDLKTIAEALPGVGFQDFANAIGVSTDSFLDMVSKGQVLADDFLPKLATALHEKFGQAAIEAADGAQAAMNRLTTAWYEFKVELANSGFLESATDKIEALAAALRDQSVQQAAVLLMNTILGVAEAVFRVGAASAATWSGVTAYFKTVLAAAVKVASGIARVTDAIGLTDGAYEKLKAASAGFWSDAKIGYSGWYSGMKVAISGLDSFEKKSGKAGSTVAKTFLSATSSVKSVDAALSKSGSTAEQSAAKTSAAMAKTTAAVSETKSKVVDLTSANKSVFDDLYLEDGVWKQNQKSMEEMKGKTDEVKTAADNAAAKTEEIGVKAGETAEKIVTIKDSSESVFDTLELVNGVWTQQQKAIDVTKEKVDETSQKIDSLGGASEKSAATWEDVWEDAIAHGVKDLDGFEQQLQSMISKDYKVTVKVETATAKKTGGLAGIAYLADGGAPFPRLRSPFITSGHSKKDDVRAMLSRYEYVQPEEATRYYGIDVMEALRRLQIPKEDIRALLGIRSLAAGGPVSYRLPPALPEVKLAGGGLAANGYQQTLRHEHHITIGSNSATVYSDDTNAKNLITMLQRAKEFSS